ncbi:uncharacterized protein LOC125026287 [Penaeus chinensis]|uniref:uncharacterized protein LOC125026287 n=1 Tax=Penaeus chinensis TaxID=139456 RepID=UPI001FB79BB2|nr:uncharacterized protein LOC125026287 [Penaeus chinensis]
MITGYLGILWHLLRKRKEMEVAMIVPELSRRRFVKSSALVLTLLLLFLVCVIPICIHNLFLGNTEDTIRIPAGNILYMIYWLQYAINFILYTAISANFRSAYRRFFSLFFPSCRRETSNVCHVFITQRCSSDAFVENQLVGPEGDSRETHKRY